MPSYPMDCTTFMSKDGPSNPKFRIPGGCLQYFPTRDSRFPYLYSLPTHALVHSTHIKKILIHIVDTSCQARIERAKFDHTLSVPLGPNKLMKEYGLLELEPGTILFARPLQDDGIYLEEDDIVESWCLDGHQFLSEDEVEELDVVRDLFLGKPEEMSSTEPRPDPNQPNCLIGGTAFERCGQNPVKGSGRCYSLTMTHQRQRALVGPTAGLKRHEGSKDDNLESLNLEIRNKITQINAHMAMEALKIGAPEDYMHQLKEHADIVNLPRIGVDENVAFPAVQANVAPAVALEDALDKGLESSMGFFGLTAGHTDDGDDEAGLTCMISNSRIPDNYEPGRFHLFGVGIYIVIKPKIASIFNGLSKHGGTPPIAPCGVRPLEDAVRLVIVFYPPKAILSPDKSSIPLASLPNGTPLVLGPEITSPYGACDTDVTTHSVLSHDADVVMEESSHLNLITMALLQTCGYVVDQMQAEVTVDVNKFLDAFSIERDGQRIRPPLWTKTEGNSVAITQSPLTSSGSLQNDSLANPSLFNMDDYRRCRQAEALRWIDLQEKRASIIARFQPTSAEEYQTLRNAVLSKAGPLLRKQKRKSVPKQKPSNKTGSNMSKTLQAPSDLLARQYKRKRLDMNPVSKSQASSSLIQNIERNKKHLPNLEERMESAREIFTKRKRMTYKMIDDSDSETDSSSLNNMDSFHATENTNIQEADSTETDNLLNDVIMTDVQTPPSPRPESINSIQPTKPRLNIAFLCNPDKEDQKLRGRHMSEFFSDELDDIKRPAVVKGSNSEFEVFLNNLDIHSIDRAIACFKDGINSRDILPQDFDPRRAQAACNRILRLTEKGSTAISNMYDIPKFWVNLHGLAHFSNLNAIESCITRVFCMQAALIFHRWLSEVIPAAINCLTPNTWLDNLAWDVQHAIQLKQTTSFNSANYLPNLNFHNDYLFEPSKVFRYDQTEYIFSVVSSIVRLWLHFPADKFSLLQLSIIHIITSKSPPSVLFLDNLWEMYKSPFTTIFNKWNKRTSKTKMKNSLAGFEIQFSSHPFAIEDSLEYRKLQYLSELIAEWTGKNGINAEMAGLLIQNPLNTSTQAPTDISTDTTQSPIDISSSITLTQGHETVLKFLRHLLPIITPSNSEFSDIMNKVNSNLDFYLPFRQHGTSLANARREIYANVNRLASPTGVGFFNVLAFRGVFFGSPFAQSNHFRWFNGYEDWEDFIMEDGGAEEEYYVKKNCYGTFQPDRSTLLLKGYWKQRNLWNTMFNQAEKPTVHQVYNWLISKTEAGVSLFRNIGPLSALLICGDLIEAGLMEMPLPRKWAEFIFKVGKGAMMGMSAIRLVKDNSNIEELCNAFEYLDLALQQELAEDEKEAMGYNVVMLEHTLCKIKRLINFLPC